MIDHLEQLPDKEVKRRFQLWLKPSVLDMADDLYEKDNCGSRSEFIEKAIQFYAGYLYAQQSQDYFPRVITSTLKGIMADSTNKISRILFKLAVEMDMMMNILAAGMEIPEEQLRELRGRCVQNVKKTNGGITLENAVAYQRGAD